MIHASASRASLDKLRGKLDEVSAQLTTSDGLSGLAQDLYGVAGVLVAQPRLRRTVADPARDPASRSGLITRLFDGKIGAGALAVAAEAATLRWSSAWDFGDALEQLGDETLMAAADKDGQLDEVEDELFRFSRMLSAQERLVTLLDEAGVPSDRRVGLLDSILSGKVQATTLALLDHAVASSRKRSVEAAIDDLIEAAAARQARSVAKVVSAVALSDAQESRLADVLTRMYGRTITVRTSVEPAVQGGLLIRVGDEVIDGTLSARFAAARAALAT